MTRWFGEAWPSPERPAAVCDPQAHADTPVGLPCLHCQQLIVDGDQGLIIPFWGDGQGRPWHIDCFLTEIGLSRGLQDAANAVRAEVGLPPIEPPSPITGFQRR